jgi:hypothetical protein
MADPPEGVDIPLGTHDAHHDRRRLVKELHDMKSRVWEGIVPRV